MSVKIPNIETISLFSLKIGPALIKKLIVLLFLAIISTSPV